MWVYFRRTTPISGEQMETIEGNPSTIRLLVFLGSIVVLVLCFYAFDPVCPGASCQRLPTVVPLALFCGNDFSNDYRRSFDRTSGKAPAGKSKEWKNK